MSDNRFMEAALEQAQIALEQDEAPVGAVIVYDDRIIASAHNCVEESGDPTSHAELLAIREAAKIVGGWRLTGCSLYVTLEPCAMCAGAIIQSRIDNVYFGAYAPKSGCAGSLYDLLSEGKFNHTPHVEGGILEERCGSILTGYFSGKRKNDNK